MILYDIQTGFTNLPLFAQMFQCFPKAEAGADTKTETSIKLS